MRELRHLFENNRRWAERMTAEDPGFFRRLATLQAPHFAWIGCSDSRVPANTIVGLPPGDVFVHRNVANVVCPSDPNCLSVIRFAVDVLGVEHVVVCGHYGCGGVLASLRGESVGAPVDQWLRPVRDLAERHRLTLDALGDERARLNRLCELNVRAQVVNVSRADVVREAWRRGRHLAVHGWIYSIEDGLLRDLDLCVTRPDEIPEDVP
jgi:carbonic anhydrase